MACTVTNSRSCNGWSGCTTRCTPGISLTPQTCGEFITAIQGLSGDLANDITSGLSLIEYDSGTRIGIAGKKSDCNSQTDCTGGNCCGSTSDTTQCCETNCLPEGGVNGEEFASINWFNDGELTDSTVPYATNNYIFSPNFFIFFANIATQHFVSEQSTNANPSTPTEWPTFTFDTSTTNVRVGESSTVAIILRVLNTSSWYYLAMADHIPNTDPSALNLFDTLSRRAVIWRKIPENTQLNQNGQFLADGIWVLWNNDQPSSNSPLRYSSEIIIQNWWVATRLGTNFPMGVTLLSQNSGILSRWLTADQGTASDGNMFPWLPTDPGQCIKSEIGKADPSDDPFPIYLPIMGVNFLNTIQDLQLSCVTSTCSGGEGDGTCNCLPSSNCNFGVFQVAATSGCIVQQSVTCPVIPECHNTSYIPNWVWILIAILSILFVVAMSWASWEALKLNKKEYNDKVFKTKSSIENTDGISDTSPSPATFSNVGKDEFFNPGNAINK